MTNFLSRERLLARRPNRVHQIETNLGPVRLQVPSVRELRDCREYVLGGPHEQRAQRASRVLDLLAAKMMIDEHGQRLLNDAEAVDGCLDDADGEVLEVIRAACSKLAGWNADPDMLAIEDAVKNSEPTPAS